MTNHQATAGGCTNYSQDQKAGGHAAEGGSKREELKSVLTLSCIIVAKQTLGKNPSEQEEKCPYFVELVAC